MTGGESRTFLSEPKEVATRPPTGQGSLSQVSSLTILSGHLETEDSVNPATSQGPLEPRSSRAQTEQFWEAAVVSPPHAPAFGADLANISLVPLPPPSSLTHGHCVQWRRQRFKAFGFHTPPPTRSCYPLSFLTPFQIFSLEQPAHSHCHPHANSHPGACEPRDDEMWRTNWLL